MWRMVVIDDEAFVRMGIQKIMERSKCDIQICAEGVDGDDGYEKVIEYRPDIILVDIRMPGMSGIELCRKLKQEGVQGKIIIMSAYSEFEYAKEAITIGAVNYLLKPIDKEQLIAEVQKIIDELEESKRTEERIKIQSKEARQEIIRQLIMEEQDTAYLEKQIMNYGLSENVELLNVAIIFNTTISIRLDTTLKEQVTQFFQDMKGIDVICLAEEMIVVNQNIPWKSYQAILKQLVVWLKKKKDQNFFITVGQSVNLWLNLNYSYESACFLKDNIFLFEGKDVITLEQIKAHNTQIPDDMEEQLQMGIEAGDIDRIQELSIIGKQYFQEKFYSKFDIKMITANLLTTIQKSIKSKIKMNKGKFPKESEVVEMVSASKHIEELREKVVDYCQRLSSCMNEGYDEDIIKRIYNYMELNYDKPLSIDSVAKRFHYSNAYFGQLFKTQMKKKFHTVLDDIRIEQSIKLLVETNIKIYEISEMVGISDPERFAIKFKERMGMSAQEYRKQSQNHKNDSFS